MKILVVTHSADQLTFDVVARALADCGARVFRLDTDRFPTEVSAAFRLNDDDCMALILNSEVLDLHSIDAVWYRRFDPGSKIPRNLDPQVRYASVMESRRALFGMLQNTEVFQLDPMLLVRRAESKQLQLRLAKRCGHQVPRTLITNDPAEARAFMEVCEHGTVAKMLEATSVDTAGGVQTAFAGIVTPSDIEHLPGLRLSPMILQERVPIHREIRATIVGNRIFAAEFDSQSIAPGQVDYRRNPQAAIPAWHACELPSGMQDALLRLMDGLGLNYGAADLILTDEGRYFFLELNPLGQFHWLEAHAGLPISRAIAEVLTRPAARRNNSNAGLLLGRVTG